MHLVLPCVSCSTQMGDIPSQILDINIKSIYCALTAMKKIIGTSVEVVLLSSMHDGDAVNLPVPIRRLLGEAMLHDVQCCS